VLSSVLILLVSSTFLVQNGYYTAQTRRTGAQDNARVVTELMSSEIRSAMRGGFVTAENRELVIRSPIVIAVVCNRTSADQHDVHVEGGQTGLPTSEVAGVARFDAVSGSWIYGYATWAAVDGLDAGSAAECAANGADTTGVSSDFLRLASLMTIFTPGPVEGDLVMLFRESTFKIQDSVMEPGTMGLFRAQYGGPPVEFATGIDSTAEFRYRTRGAAGYVASITGAALTDIDAVRIVADARKRAPTGGRSDIEFGWSVDVSVRNAR
jgi:hypothetical protein